jgi:hypothetical protein
LISATLHYFCANGASPARAAASGSREKAMIDLRDAALFLRERGKSRARRRKRQQGENNV